MTLPRGHHSAPSRTGAEWWPEPMQQAADPGTTDIYEVTVEVLARWQQARKEYLQARAALVGEIERQGWRAPVHYGGQPSSYVDVVFTGPPDVRPAEFVEVEDADRRSIRYGEWLQRDDGYWVLRIPRADR